MKKTVRERFNEKVHLNPSNGCVEWTAGQSCGYGDFAVEYKLHRRAHRFAWFLKYGYYPKQLNHICGNKLCVRLSHLYEGDKSQNAIDMVMVGEQGLQKLMPKDIIEIKEKLQRKEKTQKELAKEYSVSQSTITHINTGRRWSHIN